MDGGTFVSLRPPWQDILCAQASVPEQKGNSIQRGKPYDSINDSGDNFKIRAEDGRYQIVVEKSNQAPVYSAYDHQDENQLFQSYHSFLHVF